MAKRERKKQAKHEEPPQRLKYVCAKCGDNFSTEGNKKGRKSKIVEHCGVPAFYRGVE